jgi:hypothetical protein
MRQLQARSDHPVQSRFGFLPVLPEPYGPWLPSIPPPSCALLPGLQGGRVRRRLRDQQDNVNPFQGAVMLSPFAALRVNSAKHPRSCSVRLARISHHVSTLLVGCRKGGASAPPESRLPPSVGPVPRAACGWSPRRPRGTGHSNNQEGPVTAGLKPRPSRPVVRNAG